MNVHLQTGNTKYRWRHHKLCMMSLISASLPAAVNAILDFMQIRFKKRSGWRFTKALQMYNMMKNKQKTKHAYLNFVPFLLMHAIWMQT